MTLGKQFHFFWKNNRYRLPLILTAVLAYGFSVVSVSIGNDDTAIPFYYQEGQDVQMGRWTLFLLNKVFHFADYAPFFLELVGVLFLLLAAGLFCVLFRRITGDDDIWRYTVFSCVFVSCPSICEINYYYTHNGVDMCFCLVAAAMLLFDELLINAQSIKKKIILCAANYFLVATAIGCCESMIIVYGLAVLIVVYLRKQRDTMGITVKRVILSVGTAAILCVVAVLMRNVAKDLMVWAFDLYEVGDGESWRSVGDSLRLLLQSEGIAELKMLIKRFWLVYHVNAFVYLPVFTYAAACLIIFADSVGVLIRKKSLWCMLCWLGIYLAPFVLILAEWKVPAYRSAQFLPITAAFGMFVLYGAARGKFEKIYKAVVLALMLILVYNQAEYMNRCFYIEQMTYRYYDNIMNEVALKLEKEYGSDLPLVFRGNNETPEVFSSFYVAPYDSLGYQLVSAVSGVIDEHLTEKYHTVSGYNYGIEIYSDFFTYAYAAFDNNSEQFTIFLNDMGYSFKPLKDPVRLREADEMWRDMPSFPAEGSIRKCDGYILIRLGNR